MDHRLRRRCHRRRRARAGATASPFGLLAVLVVSACGLGLSAPGAALAEASWRLEQPAPPAGAAFKVPLGTPNDMEFYAPNEGLLSVEGNATIPAGLFFWNGRNWHQLSTVCGGAGEASRIAWAGPDEFWVITEPSEPRAGAGLGLCHFKDGVVVGSYSTAYQSPEPFRAMDAAACDGPDDCWFAGIGSEDPSGQHVGAYHLHWNGTSLIELLPAPGPRRQRPRVLRRDVLREHVRRHAGGRYNRSGDARHARAGRAGADPQARRRNVHATSPSCRSPTKAYRQKAPSCCRPSLMAANCGSPAAAPPRARRRPRKARFRVRRWSFAIPNPFYQQVPIKTSLFGDRRSLRRRSASARRRRRMGGRPALRPARQLDGQGEGGADRSRWRRHDRHAARQRRRPRQRPVGRRHRPRRSLDGDLGGLALSLLQRDRPARRHRPQLGRHDHRAPERVGRAVRPRYAPPGRLATVRAAAGRGRTRGERRNADARDHPRAAEGHRGLAPRADRRSSASS